MKTSIVIPAKNEQDNVKPLIDEIVAAMYDQGQFEIVYVDDGSDDGTYAAMQGMISDGCDVLVPVQHRQSTGQSTAIHTGIKQARGELIVTMDADGQNDPADIPKLLAKALTLPVGSHFCVAGYRKNRKDTPWKRFQSRFANRIRAALLKDETPDTGCGLKVLPRATFLAMPYFDHMHRFMPALVKRLGGNIYVVEVNHRDRQFGASKYNMLGRLGVGIVDLIGVMWLQRRVKIADIVERND